MLFKFKQFDVDQSGCAMKINTDGVLLGAFAQADAMRAVLDIGTGTGVIALMLAQRFAHVQIDAVEIDHSAAQTAECNLQNSPFGQRLKVYPLGFSEYQQTYPERKYDLIVSNPPFYINSLEADNQKTNLAKHAGRTFFEDLINTIARQLTPHGSCWLILPLPTATLVKQLAAAYHLHLQKTISIRSFAHSAPHRQIIVLSLAETKIPDEDFIIYKEPKVYSEAYKNRLRDFFTIF